ncbi:hypothetical protein KCV06_g677, partial [Aureobasidium melanogenum]
MPAAGLIMASALMPVWRFAASFRRHMIEWRRCGTREGEGDGSSTVRGLASLLSKAALIESSAERRRSDRPKTARALKLAVAASRASANLVAEGSIDVAGAELPSSSINDFGTMRPDERGRRRRHPTAQGHLLPRNLVPFSSIQASSTAQVAHTTAATGFVHTVNSRAASATPCARPPVPTRSTLRIYKPRRTAAP